jgi:dolichol-phosphate mannosyltransferase
VIDNCALSVVVPTRNEAGNVEALVSRAATALGTVTAGWEILFVDDSDDATPEVVQKLSSHGIPLKLLHRDKEARVGGLGGAVSEGFLVARGEVIAVMDGDLQHPPEVLPALVAPILSGEADLAVGTRRGLGGSDEGLEGPWRHAVSCSCRWLVHALVPRSRSVEDPLSGLFALRRSVIENVGLQPEGFKILLEVVARGDWASVANIPFAFAKRHAGNSKADLHEGLVFLRHLPRCARATRPPKSPPGSAVTPRGYWRA